MNVVALVADKVGKQQKEFFFLSMKIPGCFPRTSAAANSGHMWHFRQDNQLRIGLKMQQYFHEQLYITDFYAQFMLWNDFLCLPDPEINKGTKMACLVSQFFLPKSCFAALFGN